MKTSPLCQPRRLRIAGRPQTSLCTLTCYGRLEHRRRGSPDVSRLRLSPGARLTVTASTTAAGEPARRSQTTPALHATSLGNPLAQSPTTFLPVGPSLNDTEPAVRGFDAERPTPSSEWKPFPSIHVIGSACFFLPRRLCGGSAVILLCDALTLSRRVGGRCIVCREELSPNRCLPHHR